MRKLRIRGASQVSTNQLGQLIIYVLSSCNAALDAAIRSAHAQGMAENLLSQSRGVMSSTEPLGDVAPRHSFGVIITNRDRTAPLDACLGSLAAQDTPPAWILLSDLGSTPAHRSALVALADRYQVSYLRIEHDSVWNKCLAFNTAFKLALRSLPAVSHVIQLDADMILHPHLLTTTATELRTVSAFCCAPRIAPPDLDLWAVPGDLAEYERMLAQCPPLSMFDMRAVGVFMVLPANWLLAQRGFDEAYTGWGHEDSDMWWRVRACLPFHRDVEGTMLIHQWHHREVGSGRQGQNWPFYVRRLADSEYAPNPSGWGDGQISESVLRVGWLQT